MKIAILKREKAVFILIAGLVLAGIPNGLADRKDDLFRQGNSYYQAGQYEQALESYQKILNEGYESGVLYFNMGNCCYKLSRIGQSILFFERAKKWMPADEDLKTNLALANLAVVDKIEIPPEFFFFKIIHVIVYLIPKPILLIAVIVFYFLAVGCFILWMLGRKGFWRSAGLRGAVAFGVPFAVLGVLLFSQIHEDKTRREAIILASKADVMSAPGEQEGTEVFTLHEGTKVSLDRESGQWIEIVLPDRKVGWVKKDALGVI
jgi:tetratricopeptide (TPR) repeat protein